MNTLILIQQPATKAPMKDRILLFIAAAMLCSCASFDYRRNDPVLYVSSKGTLDTAYFHSRFLGLYHVTNTKEYMSDSLYSFLIRKRDAVRVDATVVSTEEVLRHRNWVENEMKQSPR